MDRILSEQISTFDCTGVQIHNSGLQPPDPEHSFGPVVRTEYILQYVLSGSGILRIRDQTYSLKKGDLFLLEPDVLLYYSADPKEPYSYYWVGFGGANAANLLAKTAFSPVCNVLSLDSPEVGDAMGELFRRVLGRTERDKLLALSAFYRLFGLLSADRPRSEFRPNAYVQKAVEFIRKNYRDEIRIGDVCREVGLERTYFSVLFKRATGMSPVEYLIHCRLTQACRLLETDLTITEVGSQSGFGDAANFSVRFRKYAGYSPRDYRKLMFGKKD